MTLFTSDNNYKPVIRAYGIATVFCVIFASVYEYFSHRVYSLFMICSPLIPLFGGVVLMLLLKFVEMQKPCRLAMTVYNWSMASLTMGSIMSGVFEIYGSKSYFTPVYWIAGLSLFALSTVIYLVQMVRHK